MKFDITGRHIDITPALRSHVEAHLDKIETLFDGKPANTHVIIEVERGRHHSEIVVNWRNEVLTAKSSDSDMYNSLTQTIGKIEKQARKLKAKIIDKSHKATKAATVATAEEPTPFVASEPREPRIIVSHKYAVKPMTAEEAVMLLTAGKDDFLLFRDAESSGISLIHKRKDGNYGLIQP